MILRLRKNHFYVKNNKLELMHSFSKILACSKNKKNMYIQTRFIKDEKMKDML